MHAFSHKAVKDYEKITLRKRQLSCGMGVPVFAHFSFQRGRKRFDRIFLEDFWLLWGGVLDHDRQLFVCILPRRRHKMFPIPNNDLTGTL